MKDWTDIVSSRLKDASGEMPNGSWETLASDIAARSRRRRIFGWSGASAAAAALALLLLIPDNAPTTPEPVQIIAEQKNSTEEIREDERIESQIESAKPLIAEANATKRSPVTTEPPVNTESEEVPAIVEPAKANTVIEQPGKDTPAQNDSDEVNEPVTQEEKEVSDIPDEENDVWAVLTREDVPERTRKPLLIGASGSYGVVDDGPNALTRLLGISYSFEEDINHIYEVIYNHLPPLKFGFSIGYPLGGKLTLSSGLDLLIFKSTVTRKEERAMQTASYLSVPLRFDYQLVSVEHFSAYAGVGVQADRCIAANLDGQPLKDDRINLSAGGQFRIQYDFAPWAGLYLQPELYHYFLPDHPAIKTFRTSNPTMLSVSAGLRFKLGESSGFRN
jgi:hypothetical protein